MSGGFSQSQSQLLENVTVCIHICIGICVVLCTNTRAYELLRSMKLGFHDNPNYAAAFEIT